MKKRAFTLAELLISMAIIGVLSALMVPVMTNWQKKSLETQTVHFYAMMSNALKQYMVDNDTETLRSTPMYYNYNLVDWNNGDWQQGNQQFQSMEDRAYAEMDRFMREYFNIRKVCEVSYQDGKRTDNDCFSQNISNLNEMSGQMQYTSDKIYLLANGVAVAIRPPREYPGEIQFDVNGPKGPNIAGRDIWYTRFYNDGVISDKLHGFDLRAKKEANFDADYAKEDYIKWSFEDFCNSSEMWYPWTYGAGCFARFENNGFKFDY